MAGVASAGLCAPAVHPKLSYRLPTVVSIDG